MKKFWNWIKNSDDTRILRLEGPIDEESFWGDEITPEMFRRHTFGWKYAPSGTYGRLAKARSFAAA